MGVKVEAKTCHGKKRRAPGTDEIGQNPDEALSSGRQEIGIQPTLSPRPRWFRTAYRLAGGIWGRVTSQPQHGNGKSLAGQPGGPVLINPRCRSANASTLNRPAPNTTMTSERTASAIFSS